MPLSRIAAMAVGDLGKAMKSRAQRRDVKPVGWSSPSVYCHGDTMRAMAAEDFTCNIDQMDSDVGSHLKTPDCR